MEDIQTIVNNHVAKLSEDGSIQATIEKSIESAITKSIEAEFESYGSITKQIKTAIEEGLQINLRELPFETYNQQMLVAVKTRLGNLFAGAASDKFMAEMDELLKPAPKEMPFKEFVETVVEFWKSDEYHDRDELDDYATAEIDDQRVGSGVSFSMWKKKEYNGHSSLSSRKLSADLQLYIIDGRIRINHRHGYNPTCFSEHEAFVFKLYAAGTVLTGIDGFDADDCDLKLREEEY